MILKYKNPSQLRLKSLTPMFNNILASPHYQSYVHQREQSTIYTCEHIDWDGGVSLFSTIVTPGHTTRHC